MHCGCMKSLAFISVHDAESGITNLSRLFEDDIEHRGKIAG
jgi:hypothetical protein